MQLNIAQQKAHGRAVSQQGEQILFHEKSGHLFAGMWVEDENGNHVHAPMV